MTSTLLGRRFATLGVRLGVVAVPADGVDKEDAAVGCPVAAQPGTASATRAAATTADRRVITDGAFPGWHAPCSGWLRSHGWHLLEAWRHHLCDPTRRTIAGAQRATRRHSAVKETCSFPLRHVFCSEANSTMIDGSRLSTAWAAVHRPRD